VPDSSIQVTYGEVEREIEQILKRPPGLFYLSLLSLFGLAVATGFAVFLLQVYNGLGLTGLGQPVMWAVYVTTFAFWVGIGHAGTLISAVLYLFRSRWRPSIYRVAETMTVFAIATAGVFPIVHLGRPWFFYFLFFYPNQRVLQPNFHSPLVWDAFAVGTYFVVSCVFLYVGAVPDLASVAAASDGWRARIYRLLSFNWRGDQRQWRHFATAYLLMAGLIFPLVISVHSVVSLDFAAGQLPGWHDSIFPPYFVASAIYSGLGTMIVILIIIRKAGHLEDRITPWHFSQLAKLALLMGLIVGYCYIIEHFMAWYSNDEFEQTTLNIMRPYGGYGALMWLMFWCNCIYPLGVFSRKLRTNMVYLFMLGIFCDVGVWLDHFVIIAGSLTTNFMPSQWKFYSPTWVEGTIEGASFALFLLFYFLAYKTEPLMSTSELKSGLQWLVSYLRKTSPGPA
jgi:Ni/Fe-hydrogenase subunit HybB-like protein